MSRGGGRERPEAREIRGPASCTLMVVVILMTTIIESGMAQPAANDDGASSASASASASSPHVFDGFYGLRDEPNPAPSSSATAAGDEDAEFYGFYGFYGLLRESNAPTVGLASIVDNDGGSPAKLPLLSPGANVGDLEEFYGFYGFYGLPHESSTALTVAMEKEAGSPAAAPPLPLLSQGAQIGISSLDDAAFYGFYGFYGLRESNAASSSPILGLAAAAAAEENGPRETLSPLPPGAQIGPTSENNPAECEDSMYGLCDSFYGFYGLREDNATSSSPLVGVGLASIVDDEPETPPPPPLSPGAQIGPSSERGDAECNLVYGLCESFYGFYGLNPNATNGTGDGGSSLFGIGSTVDGNASDVRLDRLGQPIYATCEESPGGCYPNNWTEVWTHDAPKVKHPVGSSAGATTSRTLYSGAITDLRTLPYDVQPGHGAVDLTRPHGAVPAPTLLKIYPRSGPHEGGTNVTIHGAGFEKTGRETCRFGGGPRGGEIHVVPARVFSATKLHCESPSRLFSGYAVVTVSMDGMIYSGEAVSATQGSGTFAVFNFTDHVPAGHFTLDNTTGPFEGGTLITITLRGVVPTHTRRNSLVHFNWTRRVYLNDTGVTPIDDANATSAAEQLPVLRACRAW